MEADLPPGISSYHPMSYLSGCRTASAFYNLQPVVCKLFSFQSQAGAERCLFYFKQAKEVVRRCRHIAAILDVVSASNFTVWIMFENLQKSLETEMKERRDSNVPWTEEEVRTLLLPLLSDLAQLESNEILVSFLHPRKLFLKNSICVVSKVSYIAYARHMMKSGKLKFVMPELGQVTERDVKQEFAHFTKNNVFCLGLIAYCMLTNTDPEAIVIDFQSIQRKLGTLQLSEPFARLMHHLVAFDPSMRSNFTLMVDICPLDDSEIQLKLGENFITVRGVDTYAEARELVENALRSQRFDFIDENRKLVDREDKFKRVKAAAARAAIPLTLEVRVHFEMRSPDSSALG